MVSRSKAFIVPVCVDGTSEKEADVPETFSKVQWTRLPDGETPAHFCERIKVLLDGSPLVTSATAAYTPAQSVLALRKPWWWVKLALAGVLAAVGLASTYYFLHAFWPANHRQMDGDSEYGMSAHIQTLPLSDERSIAVLPFANLSADPGRVFLSDGVADEILNLLANVPGLRVTSRTSSFSFRGQQLDLRTIARRLGVSYIVEGSVQSAGGRVQVIAQLIDVASDAQLWRPWKKSLGI